MVVGSAGDRRFRLDFPWDSTKTLSLRANNLSMKKSWMEVLTKTLKEASSQIKDTGSVFALGGEPAHGSRSLLQMFLFVVCSIETCDCAGHADIFQRFLRLGEKDS